VIFVLTFLAAGVIVVFAGVALARHADTLAGASKLGRLWIGAVLLAGATSLPELATDVAAVALGAPDIAAGDLFGSSMANMLILGVLDLLPGGKPILARAALDHALGASLAILLNALAVVLVVVQTQPSLGRIDGGSLLLFLVYLAGMRAIHRYTLRQRTDKAEPTRSTEQRSGATIRNAAMSFALAALAVLVAAPAFGWSAKGIAQLSGAGHTFVGTWLVALATSLPELVASLAALRIGALDLAVGNLFGSNAFNMALFVALDLAQPGSLFAVLDPSHAVSGLFAVVLMTLGLAAIVYRAERRFGMLEPNSLLMLLAYGVALWLLYRQSQGAPG